MARREALDLLSHLKPGGRWMELVYPRERWLREGAPAFEQWGKVTDGERTPWAVLGFEFCSHNYRWLDMEYTADKPFRVEDYDVALLSRCIELLGAPLQLEAGARRRWFGQGIVCPQGLFAPAATIDLGATLRALPEVPGIAVDLECRVAKGAVGIGAPAKLVVRNFRATGRGVFALTKAELRPAN